jgi:(p)ppGpp synthase/HD superfamily hydrolase
MDYSEPCKYSIRLIAKLKSLDTKNVLDFNLINKAIYYAKKYHGSQLRKSGEPFYSHPLEVAYLFAEYTAKEEVQYYTTDLIITAIMHDTIEDTSLTKEMISQAFNESIASKVEDLTRIKVNKKIPAGEILELVYPQNKKDILYIKLFDRLHNMRTIAFLSEIKRNKVIDETVEYFVSLCSVLGLYEVKKELITLSYQHKSLHNYPIFAANDASLPDPFSFLPSILTK